MNKVKFRHKVFEDIETIRIGCDEKHRDQSSENTEYRKSHAQSSVLVDIYNNYYQYWAWSLTFLRVYPTGSTYNFHSEYNKGILKCKTALNTLRQNSNESVCFKTVCRRNIYYKLLWTQFESYNLVFFLPSFVTPEILPRNWALRFVVTLHAFRIKPNSQQER